MINMRMIERSPRRMVKLPGERLTTLYLRSIPLHLRDQFKGYCASRGCSMNAMVVHLMEEVIRLKNDLEVRHKRARFDKQERKALREAMEE